MSSISVCQDRRARCHSWNLSDPAVVQGHASAALPSQAVRNVRTMSFSLYLVPEWGVWRFYWSFFREIFISQTLAAPLFDALPTSESVEQNTKVPKKGQGWGWARMMFGEETRSDWTKPIWRRRSKQTALLSTKTVPEFNPGMFRRQEKTCCWAKTHHLL